MWASICTLVLGPSNIMGEPVGCWRDRKLVWLQPGRWDQRGGRASWHGEGFGSSYTGSGKPGEGFKREKMCMAAVQRVMSGGTRVEAGRWLAGCCVSPSKWECLWLACQQWSWWEWSDWGYIWRNSNIESTDGSSIGVEKRGNDF